MDFLKSFELDLDREVYYAGETVTGRVVVENSENMRIKGVRLHFRGKAHTEWKINRAGERRTVRQDEHYIDERRLLWGRESSDEDTPIPILPRGIHTYPFEFKLPESALPCSFESKYGTIRYYIRVTLDIPYASCPQGVKYFTIIGPHIDCMDERLLAPAVAVAKRNTCILCCGKGPLLLRGNLERTGYCCGENVRLKLEIQNGGDYDAWADCKLIQHVEFFINKGVLGLSKEVHHAIVEVESERVRAHHTSTLHSLSERCHVPVCPPTMLGVSGLVQIYYSLKLCLNTEAEREVTEIEFPVTIATLPFRIPNSPMPDIHYDVPVESVEGGNYISSEFQMGQVYMGDDHDSEMDKVVLYRPVYVTVRSSRPPSVCRSSGGSRTNLLQVPGSSRGRSLSRSRENVTVYANGSRHGSREDVSTLSRVRLDSSEDRMSRFSDDDLPGIVKGSRGAEAERVPLMSSHHATFTIGAEGLRTATGSAAASVGVTAAAAAATSPTKRQREEGSGQVLDWALPLELMDNSQSGV